MGGKGKNSQQTHRQERGKNFPAVLSPPSPFSIFSLFYVSYFSLWPLLIAKSAEKKRKRGGPSVLLLGGPLLLRTKEKEEEGGGEITVWRSLKGRARQDRIGTKDWAFSCKKKIIWREKEIRVKMSSFILSGSVISATCVISPYPNLSYPILSPSLLAWHQRREVAAVCRRRRPFLPRWEDKKKFPTLLSFPVPRRRWKLGDKVRK